MCMTAGTGGGGCREMWHGEKVSERKMCSGKEQRERGWGKKTTRKEWPAAVKVTLHCVAQIPHLFIQVETGYKSLQPIKSLNSGVCVSLTETMQGGDIISRLCSFQRSKNTSRCSGPQQLTCSGRRLLHKDQRLERGAAKTGINFSFSLVLLWNLTFLTHVNGENWPSKCPEVFFWQCLVFVFWENLFSSTERGNASNNRDDRSFLQTVQHKLIAVYGASALPFFLFFYIVLCHPKQSRNHGTG